MKTKYEAYAVGSQVWALSRYNDSNGETDHCAIYPAIVGSITIDQDDATNSHIIEYWVKTPKGDDWGDSVEAEWVSDSFEELVEKLKEEWTRNANRMDRD
jgi:hypothetical protein